MAIKVKLAAGTPLWFGSYLVTLPANQTVEFATLNTMDEVAEVLAGHAQAFALNKDRLTHKEDGKTVRYGLGGRREEV